MPKAEHMHRIWSAIRNTGLLVILLFIGCRSAHSSSCRDAEVVSIPSRPALASATELTQCGVAEVEYGIEQQWLTKDARHAAFAGGIRFGLAQNLDLHWFSGNFQSLSDPSGTRTGYGDNWFGVKYRFAAQTKRYPGLGVFYQAKVPTAGSGVGGTGKVDHSLAVLASKDVKRVHFDFNAIPQFIARQSAPGFDHNFGVAWATSMPATSRLTLVFEAYGFSALNTATSGFAAAMMGCSFRVHRQMYLDGGVDFGITDSAPQKRIYAGTTYAVGNIYGWLLGRRN